MLQKLRSVCILSRQVQKVCKLLYILYYLGLIVVFVQDVDDKKIEALKDSSLINSTRKIKRRAGYGEDIHESSTLTSMKRLRIDDHDQLNDGNSNQTEQTFDVTLLVQILDNENTMASDLYGIDHGLIFSRHCSRFVLPQFELLRIFSFSYHII